MSQEKAKGNGEHSLRTSKATIRFGGLVAVNELDMQVKRGEIFGLIGPNGAGKSTTIKCLTGLLKPTAGTMRILGIDPLADPIAVKKQVGVVPEDLALFDRLTAAETLAFIGRVHALPAGTISGVVDASKAVTINLYREDDTLAASVPANPDGTFAFTALPGTYRIAATASGFLSAQTSVTLTGLNTVTLPTITLLAGDIDNNNVIDQLDALTIGMNYNGSTPTAADLNSDGTINVLDLELLAQNDEQALAKEDEVWPLFPRMGFAEAAYLTAVGDTVHVAARLEELTKTYASQLVISEMVAVKVPL